MCRSNVVRSYLLSVLTVLCSFPAGGVGAEPRNNPDPIEGWTHAPLDDDSPEGHGVILPGGPVIYSSPAIADIDGDPENGLEVAIGSDDGTLTVVNADGSVRWSKKTPIAECSSGGNKLLSSPAVGDLLGNGAPAVVIGYGGVGSKGCDGGVAAYRGSTGALLWTFSLKRFARQQRFGTFSYTVFSSPALADTDGDGTLEIGFGSFDRNVYLLNANGTVRWYYNAADTIWSSPAFANVDSDPKLELIIGTDISANGRLRPPTKNGGYVYAFKTTARRPQRIFFRDRSAYKWQTYLDQVVYSSPVVADVLASNPGEEVIVGSGCFFPQGSSSKKGRWIKVLRLGDGRVLATLPTTACLPSSVAVADLNDDGVLDIIATVNGDASVGGDGRSRIMAFRADSTTPLWSIVPRERNRNDPFGGHFTSPIAADLDRNGSIEIIVANNSAVGIYAGSDGSPLTCQDSSCVDSEKMLFTWSALRGTPAVGDINGDGDLDVVMGGSHAYARSSGVLYGWTNFSSAIHSFSGFQSNGIVPWGMSRGNAAHTGRFGIVE